MPIGVIGCGSMGSAFATHLVKKDKVYLFDRNLKKCEELAEQIGARACSSLQEVIDGKDTILLAIKPKDLKAFGSAALPFLKREHLVISVLAGSSTELLRQVLPTPFILRIMPNFALLCGKGLIGLCCDDQLPKAIKNKADTLIEGMGLSTWLPESKMGAFTALTSSGPAFIFVVIEAMVQAGVSMGLTSNESMQFALKTIEGSVALLDTFKEDPAVLKWKIASPAGTTITGLNALEEHGVRAGIIQAFRATFLREKELFT